MLMPESSIAVDALDTRDLPASDASSPRPTCCQDAPKATSQHRHRMPFGAEWVPDVGVHFRLWAPTHAQIGLRVDHGDAMSMACRGDGWHERLVSHAAPGSTYEFLLPEGTAVPDPASRYQPQDVHGPSEVIDPTEYAWRTSGWRGRPWRETVLYEMHIGTFTPEGTFRAALSRLDYLQDLGITAIEVMPVADFPGARSWGYDGVLMYAPDSSYGRPEDFKAFVDAAHERGIQVLLDVVYNHFGPDGNYLPAYAPGFFTERHHTPWGAALNFDGVHSAAVREFIVHNALYWLEEYQLDGLRLDAVHAIIDDSEHHVLKELAERARKFNPSVHLILENEDNQASLLIRGPDGLPCHYTAQWNDDVHHVLHVAATDEGEGYYADYRDETELLGRALAEGFAFQGQFMEFRGSSRGEPSSMLEPGAFVAFIQNHDQIGNRAFGERLNTLASPEALKAVSAVYLLLPQVPLIFMGEEWAATQPFLYFSNFGGELADKIREGRRKEFAKFPQFASEETRSRIPDPEAEATFRASQLDWEEPGRAGQAVWLERYRRLLKVRRESVMPLLSTIKGPSARYQVIGPGAVVVQWSVAGGELQLAANLSKHVVSGFPAPGAVLWEEGRGDKDGHLDPWSVVWSFMEAASR